MEEQNYTKQQEKEKKKNNPVDYSDKEVNYRNDLIKRLNQMRDNRERPHSELDGMTYLEYYESNRKKDLSYLPPKKNRDDIRIVTGTTREKDSTLLATLMSMNVEPDITAFDEDNMPINELGTNMGDWIKKSREVEEWHKKRPIIYRELISQGDVFTLETFTEKFRNVSLEKLEWNPMKDGISKFSHKERLKKVFEGCELKMIDGRKVFLGNLRKEYIEDQPVVAILNIYTRDEARVKYEKWERWKNIPYHIDSSALLETSEGSVYRDWNLVNLQNEDQVAELMIFDPLRNRFMIMLNGVMMLPIDYPLDAISPSGEIPMAQGKLEPISGFAYSKSQPTKTRIDQAIIDEVTKIMVRKFRQSAEPPKGSRGTKVYSRSIFNPGKITNNLNEGELFDLINNPGITNSDFSFYNTIKEAINEKSVNQVWEGGDQKGNPTATQLVQQREQQMMKLGSTLDGMINFERRIAWLRIYNIIPNWTKAQDFKWDETKDNLNAVYNEFSVESVFENGQKGTRIFRMTEEAFPDPREHEEEEEKLGDVNGRPTRITYIDPRLLRQMKYVWFIVINPTPDSNDKLSQLMFVNNIATAIEMFGIESLNLEYVKQRYAIMINEDYNKLFANQDIIQALANHQEQGQGSGQQQRSPSIGDAVGSRSPLSAVME